MTPEELLKKWQELPQFRRELAAAHLCDAIDGTLRHVETATQRGHPALAKRVGDAVVALAVARDLLMALGAGGGE
jgi:hypothetical protein